MYQSVVVSSSDYNYNSWTQREIGELDPQRESGLQRLPREEVIAND